MDRRRTRGIGTTSENSMLTALHPSRLTLTARRGHGRRHSLSLRLLDAVLVRLVDVQQQINACRR